MNMNQKKLKYLTSIVITIWLSTSLAYAWNWLVASEGDTLDYTKWNELVDKISAINSSSTEVTGIWTDNPQDPLDVVWHTDSNVMQIQSTSPNGRSSIDFKDDTWSFSMSMWVANTWQNIAWQSYIHAHGTHPLVLWHGGEAMRIAPWKNIGIWVQDPKMKLDINWWIKISSSAHNCDTDRIWTIQYNSTTDSFQWCRNNGWTPIWVNLH